MSLFSNLVSATIKVALTPVTVISDAVHVITGEEASSTIKNLESATEDLKDGIEEGIEGDIV